MGAIEDQGEDQGEERGETCANGEGASSETAAQRGGAGVALRAAREFRGLSVAVVAKRAGVSPVTCYHVEAGVRRPRADVLARLLRVLEVPVYQWGAFLAMYEVEGAHGGCGMTQEDSTISWHPAGQLVRVRQERDRLRDEVVALRGDTACVYDPVVTRLLERNRFECRVCGRVTEAPTHAYYAPCRGPGGGV